MTGTWKCDTFRGDYCSHVLVTIDSGTVETLSIARKEAIRQLKLALLDLENEAEK